MEDKDALEELLDLVEEHHVSIRPEEKINHISKILKASRELHMNAQVSDYDMDFVILDLGIDVNILTRQTWESMGKIRLVWSPL